MTVEIAALLSSCYRVSVALPRLLNDNTELYGHPGVLTLLYEREVHNGVEGGGWDVVGAWGGMFGDRHPRERVDTSVAARVLISRILDTMRDIYSEKYPENFSSEHRKQVPHETLVHTGLADGALSPYLSGYCSICSFIATHRLDHKILPAHRPLCRLFCETRVESQFRLVRQVGERYNQDYILTINHRHFSHLLSEWAKPFTHEVGSDCEIK
ncbi:hypothetical protein Tco_0382006 [Tanacetum coccineum]